MIWLLENSEYAALLVSLVLHRPFPFSSDMEQYRRFAMPLILRNSDGVGSYNGEAQY